MLELDVYSDFIDENKSYVSSIIPRNKKNGPYSKKEKQKRLMEIARLHFDYGYSARKIAQMMQVNRNTVTNDLRYMYTKTADSVDIFNPEQLIIVNIRRFEQQRTRLREQLDKVTEFHDRIALEKMIFDIDSKIYQIYQRIGESSRRIIDLSVHHANEYLKSQNSKGRFLKLSDGRLVSKKASKQIKKIISTEKKNFKII